MSDRVVGVRSDEGHRLSLLDQLQPHAAVERHGDLEVISQLSSSLDDGLRTLSERLRESFERGRHSCGVLRTLSVRAEPAAVVVRVTSGQLP